MSGIFGTDGVRGEAGTGWLAPEGLDRIGRAVADRLAARVRGRRARVLVGRDTRASGPSIEERLVRALSARGIGVDRAGVLPTPAIARLTRDRGCDLGIVISASHNPWRDNGIKLLGPDGGKLSDDAEVDLERRIRIGGEDGKARKSSRGPVRRVRMEGEYLKALRSELPGLDLRGLRIVVDAANGAGCRVAPALFRSLGARVVAANIRPDGRNINKDCGALHPDRLAPRVRASRADLGVALDGDGDRAMFVDATGAVRDGDDVLAIAARRLLAERRLPRRAVVGTVMTNFGLESLLRRSGIRLLRTKVGDRYVTEAMEKGGYAVGGEPSGHIVFADPRRSRRGILSGDGLLTALHVLRILRAEGRPLHELAAAFVKTPQVLINVPVREKRPFESVPAVARAERAAEAALGAKGRLLLRYSGTESLARVMVEGEDAGLVNRTAEAVARAVRQALGAGSPRALAPAGGR